jgi:hypothetical protein
MSGLTRSQCLKGAVALIQAGSDAGHVPRQQRVGPFDRMVCDPGKHLAQVVFGVEAVQLGGLCRPPCIEAQL